MTQNLLNQKPELIFEKQKLGELLPLKMPDLNKRKLLLKTKTLICKTQNANLKRNLFLKNRPKDLLQVLANGWRYPRWGGRRDAVQLGK